MAAAAVEGGLKLNLGCGEVVIRRNGWKNYDAHPFEGAEQQDISKLPEADNTVDRIVMSHVLEHLEDPTKVLKECYRVLKPGGAVVIAVPDNSKRQEWIGFHLATLDQRKDRQHLEDHHADYTVDSLMSLIYSSAPWTIAAQSQAKKYWELASTADWQLVVEVVK